MRLINLKKLMFAALGSVMGALSALLVILPLAGAIQAPHLDTFPTTASRPLLNSSILPGELAGGLSSKVEDIPFAEPQVELPSVNPTAVADRRSPKNFAEPPFSQEAIDYLTEVGFGVEYGSSTTVLHKWTEDVNLRTYGSPTPRDLATLTQVVAELNELISGIELTLNDGPADIEVHFAPESRFHSIEPDYIPTNYGFFRVWWDHEGAIYKVVGPE